VDATTKFIPQNMYQSKVQLQQLHKGISPPKGKTNSLPFRSISLLQYITPPFLSSLCHHNLPLSNRDALTIFHVSTHSNRQKFLGVLNGCLITLPFLLSLLAQIGHQPPAFLFWVCWAKNLCMNTDLPNWIWPWSWRQHVPLKYQQYYPHLRTAKTQK
jgi:hypothetical protein